MTTTIKGWLMVLSLFTGACAAPPAEAEKAASTESQSSNKAKPEEREDVKSTTAKTEPSNVGSPPDKGGDVRLSLDRCVIRDDVEFGLSECTDDRDGWSARIEEQSDGSRVIAFYARSFTIPQGAAVRVDSKLPIALIAGNEVRIDGAIVMTTLAGIASGGGFTGEGSGGPGAGLLGSGAEQDGTGGGSYCGRGGDGGGATRPGAGGPSYGTPELRPLVGGSAGGGGDIAGHGGGAIQIFAGSSIVVGASGVVSAPGNGGHFWTPTTGGGSGGAILLEAPEITIAGTLAANGGAGAASGLYEAASGNPSATRAAAASMSGGDGSAGKLIDGSDGRWDPTNEEGGQGGGGGGAGRIRINTKTGKATIQSGATLSPSLDTACATQGKL